MSQATPTYKFYSINDNSLQLTEICNSCLKLGTGFCEKHNQKTTLENFRETYKTTFICTIHDLDKINERKKNFPGDTDMINDAIEIYKIHLNPEENSNKQQDTENQPTQKTFKDYIYDLLAEKMNCVETENIEPHPRLRRTIAKCPRTPDENMKWCSYDLTHITNFDLLSTTNALKNGKFKHPRARQMSAAARYGFIFSPREAFRPEEWHDKLVLSTLYWS